MRTTVGVKFEMITAEKNEMGKESNYRGFYLKREIIKRIVCKRFPRFIAKFTREQHHCQESFLLRNKKLYYGIFSFVDLLLH